MPAETPKPYDPMKNLPSREDYEMNRLMNHYATETVLVNGQVVPKYRLCPVCNFAMALRGDDVRRQRLVCAWEPAHTPAK